MYFDTNPDEFLASHALTTLLRRDHFPMFFLGDGKEMAAGEQMGTAFHRKSMKKSLGHRCLGVQNICSTKNTLPKFGGITLFAIFFLQDPKKSRNNNISLTNKNPPRTVEINSEVLRQMVQSSTSNIRQVLPGCWAFRETLKIHMVYVYHIYISYIFRYPS